MKKDLLKRLHELMIKIVKADEPELDKIGLELVEIEKKLMAYKPSKKQEKLF
ncbi:MAG: hypothetical protein IIT65_12410 [Lachnospiraceae bacterium]|nr:hypothetical protein [Lachnospiraceae bacterium]